MGGSEASTTERFSAASIVGYLFWDEVHPTMQAHRRLAEAPVHVLGGL
jgi:phospholipase/lecithinase/hemolysin